jgi:serine/threonine protein kinase
MGLEGKNLTESYHYYAREMLGQTLSEIESTMKFDMITILKIGVSLLSNLEEIHNAGIIHNDLKPDNITIGMQDSIGSGCQIKMKDFASSYNFKEDLFLFRENSVVDCKELLNFEACSPKDDLVSLGLMLI